MGVSIDRQYNQYPATIVGGAQNPRTLLTSVLATTPEIVMTGFAAGCIYLPASSAITGLAFYGSPWSTGEWPSGFPQGSGLNPPTPTFYQLYNSSGAQAFSPIVTTPGQAWALPSDIFAFSSIKIVITGASSAPVELSFKG